MALKDRTRRPTGAVPWPLLLVEGPEKTGKTFRSILLTKSERVGQGYWIDLGEGSADEYGAIEGVNYEIVQHDGSWRDIYQAVRDVYEEAERAAAAKEKPVVLLIDGMNAEWELHKNWAGNRARSTETNRKKLERDPNAEIKIPQNCWNDVNARHRQLMWMLMRFPGIVIMTARGKVVAAVDDHGKPIEGLPRRRAEGARIRRILLDPPVPGRARDHRRRPVGAHGHHPRRGPPVPAGPELDAGAGGFRPAEMRPGDRPRAGLRGTGAGHDPRAGAGRGQGPGDDVRPDP